MKKCIYIIIPLLVILIMISNNYLKNLAPEVVDEKLAIKIAWLLIKDKFDPYDVLESYLKAERRGSDWYVGLDYERMYYEDVPYDDNPDYKVVIKASNGRIKLVKSSHGQTIKYKRDLIDKELAIQIAESLLRAELSPSETYDIFLNAEKKRDSKIDFDFEIAISAQSGKINTLTYLKR